MFTNLHIFQFDIFVWWIFIAFIRPMRSMHYTCHKSSILKGVQVSELWSHKTMRNGNATLP